MRLVPYGYPDIQGSQELSMPDTRVTDIQLPYDETLPQLRAEAEGEEREREVEETLIAQWPSRTDIVLCKL